MIASEHTYSIYSCDANSLCTMYTSCKLLIWIMIFIMRVHLQYKLRKGAPWSHNIVIYYTGGSSDIDIGKGISRGAASYVAPVRSYECGKKPWTIDHGFRPES